MENSKEKWKKEFVNSYKHIEEAIYIAEYIENLLVAQAKQIQQEERKRAKILSEKIIS